MEPERKPSTEVSEPPESQRASSAGPREPQQRAGSAGYARQTAMAMELPFALAGPVLVGGFLGYLLDRWLHSMPIGMLVLGAMGFVAGVREVQRRMKSLDSKRDGRRDQ